MMSYLEEMRKEGVQPNTRTYTIIMEAFGRKGDVSQMLKFYQEMKSLGLKPDARTYAVIMETYGRSVIIIQIILCSFVIGRKSDFFIHSFIHSFREKLKRCCDGKREWKKSISPLR